MPCSGCRLEFSELLQRLQHVQAETAFFKVEAQLKQEACERHIALLEQTVKHMREQSNIERERNLKEFDKKIEEATKELMGKHAVEVQSYRNEHQRLQTLLAHINDKLVKQAQVHERTSQSYRNRLTRLQDQLYKQLDLRTAKAAKEDRNDHLKEHVSGSAAKVDSEMTLLELYQQCLGNQA